MDAIFLLEPDASQWGDDAWDGRECWLDAGRAAAEPRPLPGVVILDVRPQCASTVIIMLVLLLAVMDVVLRCDDLPGAVASCDDDYDDNDVDNLMCCSAMVALVFLPAVMKMMMVLGMMMWCRPAMITLAALPECC